MSYSWFRQGTCTVSASDVVRFQGANITTAPNKPVAGDAFTVGGFRFYEIIFIGSDATGEYVRLNRAYEEAAGSNISYAVARFASGTQNAKLVAMASAAINQKQISLDDMYEWYTSQEDTVQFLGPDGTFTTITTYYKLSQEITAVGGNSAAITVVANNINDVKTVATNIAAVNLVAPSIPAINAANDNMPAITAVNSEIQSVITVSENIPLLNAITPSIPAINNVNNNIAIIAAVNADMVSVKNVSDNMADVKDAKPQADRAKAEADRASNSANIVDSAISAHETKAGAHPISGVNGLQSALDSKLSIGSTAVSASKLETPRRLDGVLFDGSSDISITYGDTRSIEYTPSSIPNSIKATFQESGTNGLASGYFTLLSIPKYVDSTGGYGSQLAFTGDGIVRCRVGVSPALWSNWAQFYTSSNKPTAADVTGLVGQLSSGAIIETGINANGSYTKFSNGLMICSMIISFGTLVSNPWGSLFVSKNVIFQYPALYLTAPSICGSVGGNWDDAWVIYGGDVVTSEYGGALKLASVDAIDTGGVNIVYTISSIGYWK